MSTLEVVLLTALAGETLVLATLGVVLHHQEKIIVETLRWFQDQLRSRP